MFSGHTAAPARGAPRRAPIARAAGVLAATVGALAVTAASAHGAVPAGRSIIVFPRRDFVSASGYPTTATYSVSVTHPLSLGGASVGTVTGVKPVPDPVTPDVGLIEVNHPGGACWLGTTPDIRPGDTVTIKDENGLGINDTTVVRGVTADRPVQNPTNPLQVTIKGTADLAGAAANPINTATDGLEQRMVANRDAFLLNGRRTVRAALAGGGDGTFNLDPATGNWTATYTFTDAADVTRALNAESRVLWTNPPVGTPAASTESTIYENGAGITAGPAGPACTAPLEKLPPPPGSELIPPTDPTALSATVATGNTVSLTWTASQDNVGVTDYGVYRDGVAIATVQNPDASAPAPTTFVDRNVPPGTYNYTVDAGDAVGNRSGLSNIQTVTTARPVATLPAGAPTVNEPPVAPIQVISFPARDFVSSSGFLDTDTVEVQVLRREGGQLVLVSSATQIPQADPRAAPGEPFAGIVEVNHPGGACWDGTNPDIRRGDIIREIAFRPDGTIRTVEQTTTSDVIAKRPVIVQHASSATAKDGVIEIHGMAMDANGDPIPADQVEQRLVANRDAFDLNGRRTIRAGGAGKDGAFSYDATNNPTGVNWTATYTGLTEDDVVRATGGTNQFNGRTFAGAESRALWLSATPAAAPEITIYENDGASAVLNGPAGPQCTTPEEPLDTAPPTFATTSAGLKAGSGPGAAPNTTDVSLTWDRATDDVAVYGYRVYRDGQPLRNVGADVGTVGKPFVDTDVVGSHTYTLDATDAASPGAGGNAQGTPYGNRSAQSDPVTVAAADTTAPTAPTDLVAKVATTDVTLSWTASKDNVGVVKYRIYRDGVQVGTTADGTTTTYTDAGRPGGTYSYAVDAVDAAGNASDKSAPASATVTANADTEAPTVPANLKATTPDIHVRNVQLDWTAATDNVAVSGYSVYRRRFDPSAATQDPFVKIADRNAAATTYTDANVAAGTYDYQVDAVDSAGNRSAKSASAQAVAANDPPTGKHQIIGFPARDFVSSTGYAVSEGPVTVSLFRAGRLVSTSTPVSVVEDPATPGLGAVEVNHPGGGCWNSVTPNMVPGDVIRFTNKFGVAEQTTVADVVAQRPKVASVDAATGETIVEVHGRSFKDASGNRIPVAQFESRLIANKDAFDVNGRRTLRAGGAGTDGTMAYDDATGVKWTATYRLKSSDDVARAVGGLSVSSGTRFIGAESRALWLGRDSLALNEMTIYENGSGVTGGAVAGIAGCTSGTAETPAAAASLNPTADPAGGITGITAGSTKTVTLTNASTAATGAPLVVTDVYVAGMNAGDYSISQQSCTAAPIAPGKNCTVNVTLSRTATGLRQANLSFLDNAADTTDQTVRVTTESAAAPAPPPTPQPGATSPFVLSPSPASFGTVNINTSKTQIISVKNSTKTAATIGSFVASDDAGSPAPAFSVIPAGTTCVAGASIAGGSSCNIAVQFRPTKTGAYAGKLTLTDSVQRTTVDALGGTGR